MIERVILSLVKIFKKFRTYSFKTRVFQWKWIFVESYEWLFKIMLRKIKISQINYQEMNAHFIHKFIYLQKFNLYYVFSLGFHYKSIFNKLINVLNI